MKRLCIITSYFFACASIAMASQSPVADLLKSFDNLLTVVKKQDANELSVTTFNKGSYGLRRTKLLNYATGVWIAKMVEHHDVKPGISRVQVAVNPGNCPEDRKLLFLLHLLRFEEIQTKKILRAVSQQAVDALETENVSEKIVADHDDKQAAEGKIHHDAIKSAKNNRLLVAVGAGELEPVRTALADKPDVDAVDAQGDTALIIAARTGNLSIAKLLKAHNARLDFKTIHGKTALFTAAEHNRQSILKLFLDSGLPVDTEDSSGKTLLNLFAFNRDKVMTRWLLSKRGANMHHKSSQFAVPLFDRVEAFAKLDDDYKPIYALFIQEQEVRDQKQKDELQKKQKAQDDEKLKFEREIAKQNKLTVGATQSAAVETDQERAKRAALRKKLKEELLNAERLRQEAEKAERIARHERNRKEKQADAENPPKNSNGGAAAASSEPAAAGKCSPVEGNCKGFAYEYSKDAQKVKDGLLPERQEQLMKELNKLISGEEDPVRHKNTHHFKIKMGLGYRALYTIDRDNKKIIVTAIGPRENFYAKQA